jgi:hypothetical protein
MTAPNRIATPFVGFVPQLSPLITKPMQSIELKTKSAQFSKFINLLALFTKQRFSCDPRVCQTCWAIIASVEMPSHNDHNLTMPFSEMGDPINSNDFKSLASNHNHKKAQFCYDSFEISGIVAAEIQQLELWQNGKLNFTVAANKRPS